MNETASDNAVSIAYRPDVGEVPVCEQALESVSRHRFVVPREDDSLRPVSSSVATLGEPEYFPAMYRIPSNTCKAAVSFETISGGVMFCHRGNNPPAWNKSARASAVYIKGSSSVSL